MLTHTWSNTDAPNTHTTTTIHVDTKHAINIQSTNYWPYGHRLGNKKNHYQLVKFNEARQLQSILQVWLAIPCNRRIIKILNRFEAINSLLPNICIKTLVTSNMRSNGAMHMFHTCYRVIITGQSVTRNTSNTSITSNAIKILWKEDICVSRN